MLAPVLSRCRNCGRHARIESAYTDLADVITGDLFAIRRCAACGVMWTDPAPPDLAGYYDADDLGSAMRDTPSALHTWLKGWLLRAECRRLARHIGTTPIVDIGCGAGDFAALLAGQGHQVIAIDAVVDKPRRLPAEIPYFRMDYDDYTIPDFAPPRRFAVVMRHVLEHLKDPAALLSKLITDGVSHLYIAVPNTACLERRLLGRHWYLWDPPRHLWHFDHDALQALITRLGLTVVASGYDTIPNWVPSLYRSLRLSRAPAALYRSVSPRGLLTSLSVPLNLMTPHNALWMLVRTH